MGAAVRPRQRPLHTLRATGHRLEVPSFSEALKLGLVSEVGKRGGGGSEFLSPDASEKTGLQR